ncbi:MAG: hypothetical protein Q9162_007218 [Coniocarpon cinnabarinum]
MPLFCYPARDNVLNEPYTAKRPGGSIAGLLHGIMLKRLGHSVRILERSLSSTRANHAAGMGTGAKGHDFMSNYDPSAPPHAFHCPGYQTLDGQSGVKRTLNAPLWLTSWDVIYYRLRALFDGLSSPIFPTPPEAREDDGAVSFELASHVTDVTVEDDFAVVHYDDLKQPGTGGTRRAHLVIDASGAYSVMRQRLMPTLTHPYAGFVAWRGTVPESAVPAATRNLFETRFNIFPMKDGYIVGYAVPGEGGEMEPGQRLLNYVWYQLMPEDSPKLKRAMTDVSGHTHRNTLPFGMMKPEVWAEQVAHAQSVLTPAFFDLVKATQKPFISTIRDSYAPKASFYGGRLLLVGEAVALHRPNSGMAMNQAAIHCLLLRDVLQGKMTIQQWETAVLEVGRRFGLLSVLIVDWFLGSRFGFVRSLMRFAFHLVWQRLMTFRKRLARL